MASQDDIIRQETLGILKKKSIQQRFCVLYKDRLDYFTTEESARQSEPPRGHVSLNEVDSVQADEDGFTLKLTSGQSLTLKMSEESKNLWLGALRPLMRISKAKHVGTLNAERKGKVTSYVFVLSEDSLDRYDSDEDFRSGQEARGSQLLSAIERLTVKEKRFVIEVRGQKKPLELSQDDPKEFKAWTLAFQQVLGKSLGANFVKGAESGQDSGHASASVSGTTTPGISHSVLCEGELLVKKKSKEEPRYCVLRTDHFEYFLSESDYKSGAVARCHALMEDITDFEVADLTITVSLGEKSISMRATTMEDLKRWERAWNSEEDGPQAVAPPPTNTAASSTFMSPMPTPVDKLVCCGRFDFQESGSEARPIIFALREGSIEIYQGTDPEVVKSGSASKRFLVEDIKDLEVEEDKEKFIIRLADRKTFEVFSPQGKSFDDWYDELARIFEEADSGRTSVASKTSVKEEAAEDDEVLELSKLLLKAVKTVNAMLKTERTVNQREVHNVQDFFAAMAQDADEVASADFVETLDKLDIGLSQEQMVALAQAMEPPSSTSFSLPEMEKVLQLDDKDCVGMAKKVLEKRATKAQERTIVRFSEVDKDRDGFISREEFEKFQHELTAKAELGLTRQLPGEMEEEQDDILQPSSPSRPARHRAICSGAVEVNGQPRHGVLYPDRLALFASGEDIVLSEPLKVVQIREMQTVKVSPSTFEVVCYGNDRSSKSVTGVLAEDRLREKNITSLCTVTLLWGLDGAPHKSDLDLHTFVNGVELYFKRKVVESCKLDFDANSRDAGDAPAENISLNQPGTFDIFVNNFSNRDNADVPFKVVVRKSGHEVAEHQGVWGKNRVKDDRLKVCTVTVTPEDLQAKEPEKSVETSEKPGKKVSVGTMKMQVQQAFETWQSCFAEVLSPTFARDVKGKTAVWRNLRSATDLPVRMPKRGMVKPMHHGPLKVVREDGTEQVRYFLVFSDRFEHFTDAASAQRGDEGGVVKAMDVKAVRVVEEAFIFELHSGSLEVRVPVGEDMEIWVSAFQLLFHPGNDASQTPNNIDDAQQLINRRSPFLKEAVTGQSAERGKFEQTAVASEVNDERFQHWLQTLPEKVVHWGLLGFQHQQRLAVRLTILFKDRMDSWGSALHASFGVKEDSRILMSSIRGVETVSGGLILNLGGKKVGIHVGGNDSLHQWSRALLSVLAPNKANVSTQLSSPQERARSETPRATPRKGRDWVPQVAFRTTKSISAGDGAAGGKRTTVLLRGVPVNLRKERDSLKRFCINTHKTAPEAMELLHGKNTGKFLSHSDQPGRRHVHSDVAEKPQGRSGSAISTRSCSREESASKVTGHERQISPRRRTDHTFAFWKINTEEAVISRSGRSQSQSDRSIGEGSRSRSRTPVDDAPLTPKIGSDNYQALRSRGSASNGPGVCGKVGGAGRQPLEAQRRSKSQGEPLGKVTDAGREQNGWAADKKAKFSFADKVSMAKTAPVG